MRNFCHFNFFLLTGKVSFLSFTFSLAFGILTLAYLRVTYLSLSCLEFPYPEYVYVCIFLSLGSHYITVSGIFSVLLSFIFLSGTLETQCYIFCHSPKGL